MAHKYVYLFSEGNGTMRVIGRKRCKSCRNDRTWNAGSSRLLPFQPKHVRNIMKTVVKLTMKFKLKSMSTYLKWKPFCEKKFGDPSNPLLVSVRSGARASMPGMMDTILNLGLNDTVVEGLAAFTENPRFAYDSYRRFIQMFSDVVMELPKSAFEDMIDAKKKEKGVIHDTELTADDLKDLVAQFKAFLS